MLSESAKNDVFSSVGKSDEGEKNFSLSSENDFSLPAMVTNFVPKLRMHCRGAKKTSRLLFTTSFDLRGQRGDGNREASLMFMSPLVVWNALSGTPFADKSAWCWRIGRTSLIIIVFLFLFALFSFALFSFALFSFAFLLSSLFSVCIVFNSPLNTSQKYRIYFIWQR